MPAARGRGRRRVSSPSGWQAVLVAGDNAQPVFDNAVAAVRNWLAAGGVPAQNIHVLSATQGATQGARQGAAEPASAERVLARIAALRPAPGEGCLSLLRPGGPRERGLSLTHLAASSASRRTGAGLSAGCARAPTVIIVSGCYHGGFTAMRAPNRIVITAARADRPSFGCAVERTYAVFDECLIGSLPQGGASAGRLCRERLVRGAKPRYRPAPSGRRRIWRDLRTCGSARTQGRRQRMGADRRKTGLGAQEPQAALWEKRSAPWYGRD